MGPAEEYRQLDEAARRHKREAGRHRRAAQECRQRQAELARECKRLGIRLETTEAN